MSTSSSAGVAACARLCSGGFGRPRCWGVVVVTAVGWELGAGGARSISSIATTITNFFGAILIIGIGMNPHFVPTLAYICRGG
eukprot:scaffold48017_cov23-Tisochrysis_lutea.AAC.1